MNALNSYLATTMASALTAASSAGEAEVRPSVLATEDQDCHVETISDSVLEQYDVPLNCPEFFRGPFLVSKVDGVELKLLKEPTVVFRAGKGGVYIKDLGITLDTNSVAPELVRNRLVHDFTYLHNKALTSDGDLSDDESKEWFGLLEIFDYALYCEQSAPLTWVTGRKVKAYKNSARVDWGDGREMILRGDLAEAISFVEDDEYFNARVKFVNSILVRISDVAPIGKHVGVRDDLSWIVAS